MNARWTRRETSEPLRLIVASQDLPPADWQLDEVSCEMIRELHPRVWNWPAPSGPATGAVSRSMITVPLSPEDVAGTAAVIKARYKNTAGQVRWGWIDVPSSSDFETLADGARARAQ